MDVSRRRWRIYTANGQLFHLTDPFNTTSQVTYGYDSAGRVNSRTDPAGLTWTRTYESGTGRLDTQTIVKGATQVGSFNLGYDAASNVTSRAETVKSETGGNNADSGNWTYGYDTANRMTSSTAPSGTATTYGYDGAGNRTSVKVGTANPVTTTYDLAGLPTSSSDNTSYTHDAIGELTKIDKQGGTANDWNLVYSSWGVLKSAARKTTGAPDVAYTTDALDRVLSRVAGSTTTYTYRGTAEEAAKAQVGATLAAELVGTLVGTPSTNAMATSRNRFSAIRLTLRVYASAARPGRQSRTRSRRKEQMRGGRPSLPGRLCAPCSRAPDRVLMLALVETCECLD